MLTRCPQELRRGTMQAGHGSAAGSGSAAPRGPVFRGPPAPRKIDAGAADGQGARLRRRQNPAPHAIRIIRHSVRGYKGVDNPLEPNYLQLHFRPRKSGGPALGRPAARGRHPDEVRLP